MVFPLRVDIAIIPHLPDDSLIGTDMLHHLLSVDGLVGPASHEAVLDLEASVYHISEELD